MPTTKNIENACKKAYEADGFSAVCDLVNEKYGDDTRIEWKHCPACDCEAPSLDGSCLACGTTV